MAKKSKQADILSIIEADHRKVDSLFTQMETANIEQMYACFNEIYKEFTLHAEAEQIVFYPTMREFEETEAFIEEAEAEHEDTRVLLEEMKTIGPANPEFKASVE